MVSYVRSVGRDYSLDSSVIHLGYPEILQKERMDQNTRSLLLSYISLHAAQPHANNERGS
jgi:hypothetical protein